MASVAVRGQNEPIAKDPCQAQSVVHHLQPIFLCPASAFTNTHTIDLLLIHPAI